MSLLSVFFFNDTATTEIYTLSLHDALPILAFGRRHFAPAGFRLVVATFNERAIQVYERAGFRPVTVFTHYTNGRDYPFLLIDRKSTRLNSSHANISYAVFCLKKKKKTPQDN